jgi:hypothetical protein
MSEASVKRNAESYLLKVDPAQKAVLSAILQLRKSEGKEDPSVPLGEAVQGSLINSERSVKAENLYGFTVYGRIVESTENLKALFAKHVPAKLRDVKLLPSSGEYIHGVSKIFAKKWVILNEKHQVVRKFEFKEDIVSELNQTIGTTLYWLIGERFKPVSEHDSLNLKAKGTHVAAGDTCHLELILCYLEKADYGHAIFVDLTLNFINRTVEAGAVEDLNLEQDMEREQDLEEEMSEDLDYDIDYDDWER